MFEYGTQAQKTRLVSTMEGQILGLSLQMYGCRVVQKVCILARVSCRPHTDCGPFRRSSMSAQSNRPYSYRSSARAFFAASRTPMATM